MPSMVMKQVLLILVIRKLLMDTTIHFPKASRAFSWLSPVCQVTNKSFLKYVQTNVWWGKSLRRSKKRDKQLSPEYL